MKKGIGHIEDNEYFIKDIKYFISEQLSSFVHKIIETDIESSNKLAYFNLELEKNARSILLLKNTYNPFMKKLLLDGVRENPDSRALVFELANYYINENEYKLAEELLSKFGENEWQVLVTKGIINIRQGLTVEGFGNYFISVNQMDRTDPNFKAYVKGVYHLYSYINNSKYIKDEIKEDIKFSLTGFSEQYKYYSNEAKDFLNQSTNK